MGINRNIVLKVRLSFLEHSLIKARAKATGLTKSRYVREISLGNEVKLKHFSDEEKSLFRTLVGLASNMNTIAHKYNKGERAHFELLKTIASTQIAIDKLTGNSNDEQDNNRERLQGSI